MGTSKHIDAVDLKEPGVLQDATDMTTVNGLDGPLAGRPMPTEALRRDREAAGLGEAQRDLQRHRRIVPGCAHGNAANR